MLLKINGPKSCFWQWDLNQQLIVDDTVCGEVHFCNSTGDCALVCEVYEKDGLRLVDVPNILLQSANHLTAYLCAGDGTRHQQTFPVVARNKPDDYVYTETEVKNWDALADRVKALEENTDPAAVASAVEAYMAEHPVEESDPTVPAWAKAETKPSYTAEEVGAMPADTEIPVVPTNVSAFENDAGYLTEHQDLSGYAKSEDIPDIPTMLPSPNKLTFSGAVAAEYDGSEAVEVVIPEGASGGDGNANFTLAQTVSITEAVNGIAVDLGGTYNELWLYFDGVKADVSAQLGIGVNASTYENVISSSNGLLTTNSKYVVVHLVRLAGMNRIYREDTDHSTYGFWQSGTVTRRYGDDNSNGISSLYICTSAPTTANYTAGTIKIWGR